MRRLIFGERSITKVAALYASAQGADEARARLLRSGRWRESQVVRLDPADGRKSRSAVLARGIEPESEGIFRTILRAHLFTGAVGLAIGVLAWLALRYRGQTLVVGSPLLSFIALAFFATVAGLIVGGLISLRPDHSRLITLVREALRLGQWAIVAHPFDEEQAAAAVEILRADSVAVERTL